MDLEKENKELKEYIKFLGSISDTCTFRYTKEICEGCNCPKKQESMEG
jgi:hypothetical protein